LLETYATLYLEYGTIGGNDHVTKEVARDFGNTDGDGTFTFAYDTSNHSLSSNNWAVKTTETLPDGSQNIIYSNGFGEQLLKDHSDSGGKHWIDEYWYDDNQQLLWHASPSAVTGYNGTSACLVSSDGGKTFPYLSTNSGKLDINDYYQTTDATDSTRGGVAGQPWFVGVKDGLMSGVVTPTGIQETKSPSGATVTLSSTNDYPFHDGEIVSINCSGNSGSPLNGSFVISMPDSKTIIIDTTNTFTKPSASSIQIFAPIITSEQSYFKVSNYKWDGLGPVAVPAFFTGSTTEFSGTDQTLARTTRYNYTFTTVTMLAVEATDQPGTMTLTSPVVGTTENGPGGSFGDTTTYVYDNYGRVISSQDGGGVITTTQYDPTTGEALQVVEDSGGSNPTTTSYQYTLTPSTKTVKVTDGNGNYSYTIFDIAHNAIFTLPGVSIVGSTVSTTGPITMTRSDIPSGQAVNTAATGYYAESVSFSGTLGWDGTNITLPGFVSRVGSGDEAVLDLNGGGSLKIQSLSRSLYNDAGHLVETDDYP
jgi:hypothetical protein